MLDFVSAAVWVGFLYAQWRKKQSLRDRVLSAGKTLEQSGCGLEVPVPRKSFGNDNIDLEPKEERAHSSLAYNHGIRNWKHPQISCKRQDLQR